MRTPSARATKLRSPRKEANPNKLKSGLNHDNIMQASRSEAVPLLCVDKSDNSKKAVHSLSKSRKRFEVRLVSKSEHDDLRPPVLFSIKGVFRGYNAIDAYATSLLGQRH